MIKVAAGRMACKVVDCAIQVHGGAGVSDDFPLAHMWVWRLKNLSGVSTMPFKISLKQNMKKVEIIKCLKSWLVSHETCTLVIKKKNTG